MSIIYDPSAILKKIAPASKIKKLLKGNVTLKKTALSFLNDADFIAKGRVAEVALKTIAGYQDRIEADPGDKSTILDDPKQLIQRVQNEVILQIGAEIKTNYDGEFYVWLPSSAQEPDPEHQLNYGGTFQIGVGEQPGDRYGCQCGMEILVNDDQLQLGE